MSTTRLMALMLAIMIVLAACFSGDDSSTDVTADEPAPVAAAPTDAEEEADASDSDAAPADTEADPLIELPTPTPEAESPAETTQDAAPEPPPDLALQAATVEEAAAINSYRLRIATRSQDARGAETVEVRVDLEAAYVKNPPAEEIHMDMAQGEQHFELAMVVVDGVRYMYSGDMWMQTPEANLHVDELTLITPADGQSLLGQMQFVGTETVNGRAALHYRGDKDIIPVVGTAGDTLDVSQADHGQIDVWIDQQLQVLSRLQLEGAAIVNDTEQSFSVLMEYYDFNADITITAPTEAMSFGDATGDSMGEAVSPPAGEGADLRGPVSELLGFNLLLPTGSNIEAVVENSIVIATTPFTLDEAQGWLEMNLPANGYTLLSKMGPVDDQFVYTFQQDARMLTITVGEDEAGGTRVQFAAAP